MAKAKASQPAPARTKNLVPPRARITRIPATEVFPVIEQGTWPAKATEGESFPVEQLFSAAMTRSAPPVLID